MKVKYKSTSELRFWCRFAAIVLWLFASGGVYTLIIHSDSFINLGWITLLFYAVLFAVVARSLVFITTWLWSLKP